MFNVTGLGEHCLKCATRSNIPVLVLFSNQILKLKCKIKVLETGSSAFKVVPGVLFELCFVAHLNINCHKYYLSSPGGGFSGQKSLRSLEMKQGVDWDKPVLKRQIACL